MIARTLIAALLVAAGFTQDVHGQTGNDWPSRPIRFVSISSAGSGGDTITRLLADRMAPLIKGSFVVDNRPGAGGALAADVVAKSSPDGYTILLGGFTSHVLLAAVKPKLTYAPAKDFDPIGQIGTAAILMVVGTDHPANDLKDFIALARRAPESPLYASWGIGSTGHFCGELLAQRAQLKLGHVPYKGVAQIMTDLLGGQIKVAFIDMASGSPMVKAGRIKPIASCISRSPSLPDVRGFDEDGIDFSGKSPTAPMWALYAPAGTPKPILEKLSAALRQVVETPEVRDKLLTLGVQAEFVGSEPFRKLIADGIPQWREIAGRSGIVID
jgi:tripartite-type tricarboxylate transporter receptor subunit TctC